MLRVYGCVFSSISLLSVYMCVGMPLSCLPRAKVTNESLKICHTIHHFVLVGNEEFQAKPGAVVD